LASVLKKAIGNPKVSALWGGSAWLFGCPEITSRLAADFLVPKNMRRFPPRPFFRDHFEDPLDRLVTPAHENIIEPPFPFLGKTVRRVGEFSALTRGDLAWEGMMESTLREPLRTQTFRKDHGAGIYSVRTCGM